MKATLLFRIAAGFLLLFAAGHTFGFLSFRPSTPEGLAVLDAMRRVHFVIGGSSYSYGNFYQGFGLTITISQLFFAIAAWHLGNLARRHPLQVPLLGWSLTATQAAGLVISLLYFGAGPAIFSSLAGLLLLSATLLAGRQRAGAPGSTSLQFPEKA